MSKLAALTMQEPPEVKERLRAFHFLPEYRSASSGRSAERRLYNFAGYTFPSPKLKRIAIRGRRHYFETLKQIQKNGPNWVLIRFDGFVLNVHELGSISAVFSSLRGVSAGSFPEQRLVIEPIHERARIIQT